jgi:hypothetical protein
VLLENAAGNFTDKKFLDWVPPIKTITQWGIVLLLIIQLYLWLHVHEMSGKVDITDAPGLGNTSNVRPRTRSRVSARLPCLHCNRQWWAAMTIWRGGFFREDATVA